MDVNNNWQRSKAIDSIANTITYRLRSGEVQTFDVSKEACEPFGFYFGERVKVRAGKHAWVLGVRQNDQTSNMYFHIDGDKGASYFAGFKKTEFEGEHFELLSPRFEEKKVLYKAPALKKLLEDDICSDCTFEVGSSNTIIKAHRSILICRSEYFRAMFQGGLKESRSGKDTAIPMPDIEPAVFNQILVFLYTGEVETLSEKNLFPLLVAAQQFQIDDLKELCYQIIPTIIDQDNVIPYLISADEHNESKIKELCKDYVLEHYDSIVANNPSAFRELWATGNDHLMLELLPNFKATPCKKRKRESTSPSK